MAPVAQRPPDYNSNFFSEEWVEDPYVTLEEIRSLGPVVYDESQDAYVVTGYKDCARILGNTREFSQNDDLFITAYRGVVMEATENPLHNQMRSLVQEDFRPEAVKDRRVSIARSVASEIAPVLRRMRAGEEVEAVSQLCRDLPIHTIVELLDWPVEDIPRLLELSAGVDQVFKAWHDDSPEGKEMRASGIAASEHLNEYVRELMARRRTEPGNDLVSRMMTNPHAEAIAEQDLVAQISQLVFAGHETTTKLSSLILLALAQNPEQLRIVREDRSLVPRVIEEVHRWTPPVLHNYRFARDACEVAGFALPTGATVIVAQAAANRDPARWEHASELDVTRERKAHLGFGFGLHTCLGMHLARIELEVWLNAMLDEIGAWELASPVEWGPAGIVRGPRRFGIRALL